MKKNNIMNFGLLAILGIFSLSIGATFAYFSASATLDPNSDSIGGNTYEFKASATLSAVTSGQLIPMTDNLLSSALSQQNVCIDSRGYQACNMYEIIVSNSATAVALSPVIASNNGTTFASGDLKYQLFTLSNNTYTAVSGIGSISTTADNQMMATNNTDNLFINMAAGTTSNPATATYYLVIWLSDNNHNQPLTQNKTFSGTVKFNSTTGERISADFTF